jgi:hypothetical protein
MFGLILLPQLIERDLNNREKSHSESTISPSSYHLIFQDFISWESFHVLPEVNKKIKPPEGNLRGFFSF